MKRLTSAMRVACLIAVAMISAGSAAESGAGSAIRISKWADPSKFIPVSITGFTGEVDTVLRFDLAIQGFAFVGASEAAYLISGSNGGQVEGHVVESATKARVLDRGYANGNSRVQAHALADDIVQAITGQKGISQTKIAFKTEVATSVNEVVVADFDGYNAVKVTQDNALVFAPAWAPGKRTLYYTSYRLGNPDIYLHDVTTGNRQVVARYTGLNTGAAISPNGQRMALIMSKAGSPDVYVADAHGGTPVQLTKTREDESSPTWSPDNQTICFASRVDGRPALYTISASGGAMKRLVTAGVGNATEPDWSPDGKSIVFTTQRGGASFEICVIPASGGEVKVLTSGEDPSWAPNSRTVVFTKRANGKRVLSLLDVPTKHVKDVKYISGSCSQPSWAR